MKNNMYFKLFFSFLKMGLFTIGGGLAMLPLITRFVVEDEKWLTKEEMLDGIAVAQSLPGVLAINMATYVGMKKKGVPGAVCATLGTILPSFVIIILVAVFLENFGGNPIVGGAVTGIKACAAALIVTAGIRMIRDVIKGPLAVIIAAGAFVCVGILGISVIYVIIGAALLGILAASAARGRRMA